VGRIALLKSGVATGEASCTAMAGEKQSMEVETGCTGEWLEREAYRPAHDEILLHSFQADNHVNGLCLQEDPPSAPLHEECQRKLGAGSERIPDSMEGTGDADADGLPNDRGLVSDGEGELSDRVGCSSNSEPSKDAAKPAACLLRTIGNDMQAYFEQKAGMQSMVSQLAGTVKPSDMHPALMMALLNSMNASSVAAPSGKDPVGGGVAGGGSPAVGLAGMLNKPPDSDAGKEEPKAEASKDAATPAAGESATKAAPAALAGAPLPGADVVMPTYLHMLCARTSHFPAASGDAAPNGHEPKPPPPPPPVSAPEGPRTSAGGESGAAPAFRFGIDLNAPMPFMDLHILENAAAVWQMMSAGIETRNPKLETQSHVADDVACPLVLPRCLHVWS
jgi:hypothetical protein